MCWSRASLAWNSSDSSSSASPMSITERVWPIFMAAPRIEPSTVTMRSAVSSTALRLASAFASSERPTVVARPPRERPAAPAARPPRRAARPKRELLRRSAIEGTILPAA